MKKDLFKIEKNNNLCRREFLKQTCTAAATLTVLNMPSIITVKAAPDDPIKIGVIGCGGRGTGAALDALGAATTIIYPSSGFHTEDVAPGAKPQRKDVKIIALADVFPDRLERCKNNLEKLDIKIPDEHCFVGFDAYLKLLAIPEINYVILSTPPHFRPIHLKAAIEAGKNVFIEKPVAVDGFGVRMVIEAGELAAKKKLGISAGTQRRHSKGYIETIKRIQDGAIGEIIYGRCYWNGGEIWVIERQPGWTDIEWQLRNWNYFTWLSGDHIVEQHVHNLDVMNWVLNSHPIKASALGGRQVRTDSKYGNIYDHFAVEFEYPNSIRVFSQCRQINGCEGKVEEAVLGSKGYSNCAKWIIGKDGTRWRFNEPEPNPYHQEHVDLIESIRKGDPINEAKNIAESTLAGIMGRESAYSGQTIEWDKILNSKTRLGPEKYEFGTFPVPSVAMPGRYKAL